MINWKEKILNAQPITEFPVIDCHNHLGKWVQFHIPQDGTVEQMVNSMDSLGIDKCAISAFASIGPDYVYGNNMLLDAIRKFPDRVLGYVTLNPNYPEDIIAEYERCNVNDNIIGIKLHQNQHGRPLDYKGYDPVFKYANDRSMLILIHIWGIAQVCIIEKLAQEYPNITFIMGHTGADATAMTKAIDVINKYSNVYGDTALSMAFQGNIEWLAAEANNDRILFGSDMPFYSPIHTVARIALAEISDDAKKAIFGGNFTRILNRTKK